MTAQRSVARSSKSGIWARSDALARRRLVGIEEGRAAADAARLALPLAIAPAAGQEPAEILERIAVAGELPVEQRD